MFGVTGQLASVRQASVRCCRAPCLDQASSVHASPARRVVRICTVMSVVCMYVCVGTQLGWARRLSSRHLLEREIRGIRVKQTRALHLLAAPRLAHTTATHVHKPQRRARPIVVLGRRGLLLRLPVLLLPPLALSWLHAVAHALHFVCQQTTDNRIPSAAHRTTFSGACRLGVPGLGALDIFITQSTPTRNPTLNSVVPPLRAVPRTPVFETTALVQGRLTAAAAKQGRGASGNPGKSLLWHWLAVVIFCVCARALSGGGEFIWAISKRTCASVVAAPADCAHPRTRRVQPAPFQARRCCAGPVPAAAWRTKGHSSCGGVWHSNFADDRGRSADRCPMI